jgi:drug/metabolite transporter (DMT)-like permease
MEAGEPGRSRNLTLGLIYGAVSVSIFASFVLISRIGMKTDLQAGDLLALRFGVGGIILLPVLLHYGLQNVGWRDAIGLAALGGLGFAILAYAGIARTPATHATVFLHGTLPLSTVLIIAIVWKRWPSRQRLLGIATIAAGVVAMAWDSLSHADAMQLVGDAMLFTATAGWAAYAIWAKVRNIPALQAAAIVAVLSGIAYLPFYAASGRSHLFDVSAPDLLLQALYQGVVIGVVSIYVYTQATMLLGPTPAALLTTIVPTITTLLAIPVLGEWPLVVVTIGVVLTTVGMVIALREGTETTT